MFIFMAYSSINAVQPRSTRRPFSNRPDKVLLIIGTCGIAGTIICLEVKDILSVEAVGHALKPLVANPFFLFFIWLVAIGAEWKRFYGQESG